MTKNDNIEAENRRKKGRKERWREIETKNGRKEIK